MIDLSREGDVFTMTLNAGENRWNTTFVRAIDEVLNEVEASAGAAALVTTSADAKFFSNGLDLDWVQTPEDYPAAGDRKAFGPEFMGLMSRIMTFPMPTVCAVNGHAFGAGFMSALCHDVRFMRADRGFMCANELQIGLSYPAQNSHYSNTSCPPRCSLKRYSLPSAGPGRRLRVPALLSKPAIWRLYWPRPKPVRLNWRPWRHIARIMAIKSSDSLASRRRSTVCTARPTCSRTRINTGIDPAFWQVGRQWRPDLPGHIRHPPQTYRSSLKSRRLSLSTGLVWIRCYKCAHLIR